MSAAADAARLAVFARESHEPLFVAVAHAVLLPIPVWWSVWCFRRWSAKVVRSGGWGGCGGGGGSAVLALLGASWVLNAVDTLALMLHAALYARCAPHAYVNLRPPIFGPAGCPAMLGLAASDAIAPVQAALFLTTSICRFLLTVKVLGQTATYRFLRAACGLMSVALVVKLAAVAHFLPFAVRATTDPHHPGTFREAFHSETEVPFYGMLAALDWVSVILGFRFVYKVMQEARNVLTKKWALCPSPAVLKLKRLERRYLVLAAVLLALNLLVLASYAALFASDALGSAGISGMAANFVYSVHVKVYGSCEMGAINAAASAVLCNRRANELLGLQQDRAAAATTSLLDGVVIVPGAGGGAAVLPPTAPAHAASPRVRDGSNYYACPSPRECPQQPRALPRNHTHF